MRRPTQPGLVGLIFDRPRREAAQAAYQSGGGATGGNAADPTAVHSGDQATLDSVVLPERGTPPPPAPGSAVLFAQNDGAGHTQVCAVMPGGAVVVIATEP